MNLIIVESPTKARTLSRFLGKDYSVEATMGHIKDLPKSKLGVDIENNFSPDYVVVKKRSEEIKKLRKEAKKADKIFLATDPDREGEAIAQHVKEILSENDRVLSDKKKRNYNILKSPSATISRITFHEITKNAVEEAIKRLGKINKNLVDAQIARRVLDRLVGYKLSPLLWKKVRRGLSAGRVQSVVVRLIVEREREIEAFVPKEYWEIWCNVKSQKSKDENNTFDIKLIKINDDKAKVGDEKTAKRVVSDLEKSEYRVFDVTKKEVKKNPFPPFTTSTLTQSAARLFGWSAKRTMSVAQRLYEEGLITYHRTDSTSIASAAVFKVRDFIKEKYGEKYLPEKPRIYKTKSKSAQEAHEAIRPTDINARYETQDTRYGKDTERLYQLIWKRFVTCQMSPSIYDETIILVETRDKRQETLDIKTNAQPPVSTNAYTLRASGQVMKFDGWRVVYNETKTSPKASQRDRQYPKAKNANGEVLLPDVEEEEQLDLIKVFSEQKFTQPPARYGEASLIKTLEKLGIGRPSTYAPVITTIQIRNYVEKNEGRFHPTKIGLAVNDFLLKNFSDIFEYSFTAGMENNLDNVAKGEVKWQKMMKGFYTPFEKKLETVEQKAKRVKIETEKLGKKCPDCKDGELVIRVGRFGKFISCSRFPDCKFTDKYQDRIGQKCPDCKRGHVVVKKTKRGRKFFGCSRYPKCEWASWKKPTEAKKKLKVKKYD